MKLKFIIIALLICNGMEVHATGPFELLQRKFPSGKTESPGKKYVGIADKRSAFSKYNPVTLFFDGSMFIYQKGISEQISAQCTFSPSCSEFSKKLIQNFGLIKGVFLTADRLMRCDGHALDEYPAYWRDRQTNTMVDQIEMYRWLNNY